MSLWLDFMGAEIRYVETASYGKTRIAEAGKGNKETILFLHGVGGHCEAYAKNVVALSDEFHVIAYDYVGQGMSDKPLLDYTPLTLVDHLRELMDSLGIDKAHLSGESMGGWVSGLFTIEYPERVLRLNLNTAAGLPIITDKGREELQGLIDLTSKATTQGPPTFESVKNRMKWLFHPNNHDTMITDELVNTRLTCYRQPGSKEVAPKVLGMIGMHDDYLIPMEKIIKETLFLWTEDNPCHDVPCAKNSAAKIPGSLLYIMKKDAAHWPQYESPEEFNTVIRQFFRSGTI